MKVIDASYSIRTKFSGEELKLIEEAGRACYRSEDKICDGSDVKFVERILERGHESVIEHSMLTVRFVVDRGVSHELVRHRLASFTQESTRYCNYANGEKYPDGLVVIRPRYLANDKAAYKLWWDACQECEKKYIDLIKMGRKPEEARAVLPNSTATILTMTTNFREWRHILRLRTAPEAQVQMREVMIPLGDELSRRIPILFDEFKIKHEYEKEKAELSEKLIAAMGNEPKGRA